MSTKLPILIAASAFLFTACGNNVTGVKSSKTDKLTSNSASSPVETKTPNSEKKSFFVGQTRISGVKTNTAFEAKVLSSELKSPWGIASLPDGRLLITEKGGAMKIVTQTGAIGTALIGIPAVDSKGQG
ncbi:MAG: PQQ-dependent sugar dehydrogenase, partial [Phormidesmis sp. FL-bin-119]|nr:PQQ-dependent sugar dehydrogenase [Pedobacter sp.]